MKERYFQLKTEMGPKNQNGIILKVNPDGRLEDVSEFLSATLTQKGSNPLEYKANTNVDLYGKSRGEEDIIGLRVLANGSVEIYRQSDYPMYIEEIDKKTASTILDSLRSRRYPPGVISLTPNSPGLDYYL